MGAPLRSTDRRRGSSRGSGDAEERGSEDRETTVFRALADPTRRGILDRLRVGSETTGRLASRFAMSRFGVMKHLRTLHDAGLVLVEERGRERWHHLNPVPIREIARRWLLPFEETHADRLLALRELAERQETDR